MNKSFTLVELIVVIAIIAILAAIIAPNAFRAIEKSKISKAISDFKTIKSAAYALYADTGYWPHGSWTRLDHSNLVENVDNWPGWDGPYLERSIARHPWGGTYFFDTWAELGRGPGYELTLELEDYCYPSGPNHVPECGCPLSSAQKIDETMDDGDLHNGQFQSQGAYDQVWILQWDFCAVRYCW